VEGCSWTSEADVEDSLVRPARFSLLGDDNWIADDGREARPRPAVMSLRAIRDPLMIVLQQYVRKVVTYTSRAGYRRLD
jgi:hypothetical protein